MAQEIFGEAVARLERVCRAIDVRSAIVFHEGGWRNLSTVVRLSYQDPEGVDDEYRSLESTWPKVDTARFRIVCEALPFAKWPDLVEQFLEGTLSVAHCSFEVSKRDLRTLRCFLAKHSTHLRDTGWNIIEADSPEPSRFNPERYEREANALGYPTVYTALNEWLESKITFPTPLDLVVALPTYSKIVDSRFSTEKKAGVEVEYHEMLDSLTLFIHTTKGTSSREVTDEMGELHRISVLRELLRSSERGFKRFTCEVDLPTSSPVDRLTVRLVHSKPHTFVLDWREDWLYSYLERKAPPANPLYSAFNRFYDSARFEEQFTGQKSKEKFTQAVRSLLSLCGMSVVKTDKMVRQTLKNGRRVVKVDLIAYHKDSEAMLLASCATSLTKLRRSMDEIKVARRRLWEEMFAEADVELIPTLFYPGRIPESWSREASRRGVVVIGAPTVRSLLQLIRDNKVGEALAKLGIRRWRRTA